jgi:phosphoglycerate dehydrogenase-like enzyme
MDSPTEKPVALYYSMLKFQPSTMSMLKEFFQVVTLENPSFDTSMLLGSVEILFAPMGYKTDQEKIDRCPKLKVIASNTTGHPHIDIEYAQAVGVRVVTLKADHEFLATITPTAELTWGLIIALTRNVVPAVVSVRNGEWDRRNFGGAKMLSRMSLGVVGYGRLGKMVGKYGQGMGMNVGFYDPFVKTNDDVTRYHTLEDLVRASDVVTLHVPHEKETENLFDDNVFAEFRSDAYFVNTARGELIDHDALLHALMEGKLAGAALDVIEGEFDPGFQVQRNRLWDYAVQNDNLILTPHIGGSTRDAWAETEQHTVKKVLKEFKQFYS